MVLTTECRCGPSQQKAISVATINESELQANSAWSETPIMHRNSMYGKREVLELDLER